MWRYYIQTSNQFPSALSGTQFAYYVYELPDIYAGSTGRPRVAVYYDILNRPVGKMEAAFADYGWTAAGVTQYDNRGRVLKGYEPYDFYGSAGLYTESTYDDLDRPVSVTTPAGAVSTTTYNALTVTASVDPDGPGLPQPVQTKKTVKNSQGQVVSVRTNEGGATEVDTSITYTYDPFGNLLTTTDALSNGNVTTLSYDGRGRKTQMEDPDMGRWSYKYNVLSELVWQCDPKSRSMGNDGHNPPECNDTMDTTMVYDLLGRMTERRERDLVSNWTWDSAAKGIGKLGSVSSSNGYSRSHTYDSIARPASNTVTIGTENFTTTVGYDGWWHVGQITYPGNPFTNGFGVTNIYKVWSGHLQEVKNAAGGASLWLATAVSPSGRVTNETLGNNLTVARTYNSADRLTRILTSGVQDDNYSYDLIGNLTQRIDAIHSVTETMGYDRLNRLTSAAITGSVPRTITYTYNAIGNIQTKSDVGSYAYPSSGAGSVRPHAVTGVSPYSGGIQATYGYDANGNMISVTNGTVWSPGGGSSMTFTRSLSYMSFNLPNVIEDTQNGWWYTSYTYTYGADHERVKLVTNKPDDLIHSVYVHPNNSGALLYERDTRPMAGTAEHKYYVTGLGGLVGVYSVKSASQYGMLYYHKDRLNSIVAITNQAGGIEDPLAYEAYGERRYTDGTQQNRTGTIIGLLTDRGFTSHEHLDEINLIHMNGRMYDPALGRFITPDPFIQSPGNPQSYNRYSYAVDNPAMYVDPSGYFNLGKALGLDGFLRSITDNPGQAIVIGAVAWWGGGLIANGLISSATSGFIAGTNGLGTAFVTLGGEAASLTALGAAASGAGAGFAGGFLSSGGDLEFALKSGVAVGLTSGLGQFGAEFAGTQGSVAGRSLGSGSTFQSRYESELKRLAV